MSFLSFFYSDISLQSNLPCLFVQHYEFIFAMAKCYSTADPNLYMYAIYVQLLSGQCFCDVNLCVLVIGLFCDTVSNIDYLLSVMCHMLA